MSVRGFLIIGIVLVGGCGLGVVISRSGPSDSRFEAHEFAVFRSEYDRLRVQDVRLRADHFRDLLEATESTHMTPAMGEALAEFLKKVVRSEEEAAEVKAEATLVLNALEHSQTTRAPASNEKHL